MKKSPIDGIHEVLRLSHDIVEDPVLIQAMTLAFDWANRRGLSGVRVTNLRLEKNASTDPLNITQALVCDIGEPR